MAATYPVQVSHAPDGLPVTIYGLKEVDSSTFAAGQLVYTAAGAAAEVVTEVASTGTAVLGIALKDATNVTSGNIEIPVTVLDPSVEIIMRITNGSGVAVLSDTLYPGKKYGLYAVTGEYTSVNSADTSNDAVVFIAPIYDENGTALPKGRFRLVYSVAQSQAGV